MADCIIIESDDSEIVQLLRDLESRVKDAGGFLDPRLKIVVADRQIRVESDAPGMTPLLRIPEACLPIVEDLEFVTSETEIALKTAPAGLDERRRSVLDSMLSIYNRAGKIKAHRAETPWVALAPYPDLLSFVMKARADAPKLSKYYALAQAGQIDELVARSFIGSRTLKYPFGPESKQRVLMPFIDFFNHHNASPSFGIDDRAIVVKASRPVAGSAECFVRYTMLDAMDAYLNYGFANTTARFIRSVPLRIDLPGIGTLRVLGRVSAPMKKALPQELETLRRWMPPHQKTADGSVVAAQLLIPPSDKEDVLANVMAMLITSLTPAIGRTDLYEAVAQAMQSVLAGNRDYYVALLEHLPELSAGDHAYPAVQQLRAAIGHQLEHLRAWDIAIAARRKSIVVPYEPTTPGAWS